MCHMGLIGHDGHRAALVNKKKELLRMEGTLRWDRSHDSETKCPDDIGLLHITHLLCEMLRLLLGHAVF